MGNLSLGRSIGLGTRNKEFLSVAPSPSSHGAVEAAKITHSKAGKPQTVQELLQNHDDVVRDFSAPDGNDRSRNPENDLDLKHNKSHEFQLSEGKIRRESLADAEGECSEISDLIYVGGSKVARNYDLLKKIGIKRILNCAAVVVPNSFESSGEFAYLSLNLLDGRQEDISWFVCQAIQFILDGTSKGQKVLIHCEKGISRSTSFAIAHRIWEKKENWKVAYDFIKTKRKISSPNTAFTCNIIELAELFHGGPSSATLLFRCSYHAPHDPETAVLKLCRNNLTRRILVPSTSLLNPIGVFVLRAVLPENKHEVYIWQGRESSARAISEAFELAKVMYGVLSTATSVQIVKQGEETPQFVTLLVDDGPFNTSQFDSSIHYADFLGTCLPTEAELHEAALILRTGLEAQQQMQANAVAENNNYNRRRAPSPEEDASVTSVTTSTKEKSTSHRGYGRSTNSNHCNGVMTIAGAISRSNSFSSVDSDGVPMLSNAERLNKIQMIVDNATITSTTTTPQQQQQKQVPRLSMVTSLPLPSTEVEEMLPAATTCTPVEASQPQVSGSSRLPKLPLQSLIPSSNVNESQLSDWREVEQEVTSRPITERKQSTDDNEDDDSDEDDDRMVMMTAAPPVVQSSALSRSGNKPIFDLNLSKLGASQSLNSSPVVTGIPRTDLVLTTRSLPVNNASSHRSSSTEGQRSQTKLPSLPMHIQEEMERQKNSGSQQSNSDELGRSSSKMKLPLSLTALLGGGDNSGSRPQSSERKGFLNSGRVAPDAPIPSSPSPQRLALALKSPDHSNNEEPLLARQPSAASGIVLPEFFGTGKTYTKPMLFHALLSADNDGIFTGEWINLGVYDDNDLDEKETYLLLCPESPHYLWLGSECRLQQHPFAQDESQLQNWAVNHMGAGDIAGYDVLIVESDLSIQRAGDESDEFWDRFNEGF